MKIVSNTCFRKRTGIKDKIWFACWDGNFCKKLNIGWVWDCWKPTLEKFDNNNAKFNLLEVHVTLKRLAESVS